MAVAMAGMEGTEGTEGSEGMPMGRSIELRALEGQSLPGLGTLSREGVSIVTVCMNRLEHLRVTAARVAAWTGHREHLIVDWSSAQPVPSEQLPADPRIRLLRVEGESSWNLCRAYNFAVAQARSAWILKLDADTWPTAAFDPAALGLLMPGLPAADQSTGPHHAFGSGGQGRRGQFLMPRQLFKAVGGFHELLVGYGFDDKDLEARLALHTGLAAGSLPEAWIGVIPHSDAERAGLERSHRLDDLEACQGLAAMRASRLGNRLMAAHCPWSARAAASQYREEVAGVWRVEPASIPRPSATVADELDHARRMVFWGCFLAIPDVFLAELPIKLVPYARHGRWDVRWWHRLWWRTGRRLLHLPVLLLSLGRGRLEVLRGAVRPT